MTSLIDYNSSTDYAEDIQDDIVYSVKSMFTLVTELEKKLERVKDAYTDRSNDELTEQQLMDILDDVCY